ncbi:MAG: nucleotidyltransferase domain-containing protein, partial [Candidatus Jacksonbacteria bacterium]
MSDKIQLIKQKIEPILKRNDIEFAAIFGSYARGDQNKRSDIDLLVRFSKPKSLLMLVRLERDIANLLNVDIDMVTEHALSP